MNIRNQTLAIISAGGNLSDIADGADRLKMAAKGLSSLGTEVFVLATDIRKQFNAINRIDPQLQGLYGEYQTSISDFRAIAREAESILSTAKSAGTLSVLQSEKLEKLNDKAVNAIKKLKNIKEELIRRRLEGDDGFDDRGGAAPRLLVTCEA